MNLSTKMDLIGIALAWGIFDSWLFFIIWSKENLPNLVFKFVLLGGAIISTLGFLSYFYP